MISAALLAATQVVVWHAYRGAERRAFEKVAALYVEMSPPMRDALDRYLLAPADAGAG